MQRKRAPVTTSESGAISRQTLLEKKENDRQVSLPPRKLQCFSVACHGASGPSVCALWLLLNALSSLCNLDCCLQTCRSSSLETKSYFHRYEREML